MFQTTNQNQPWISHEISHESWNQSWISHESPMTPSSDSSIPLLRNRRRSCVPSHHGIPDRNLWHFCRVWKILYFQTKGSIRKKNSPHLGVITMVVKIDLKIGYCIRNDRHIESHRCTLMYTEIQSHLHYPDHRPSPQFMVPSRFWWPPTLRRITVSLSSSIAHGWRRATWQPLRPNWHSDCLFESLWRYGMLKRQDS